MSCSGLRGVLTTCVGCMWLRSGHVLFSTCSDPFKGYQVIFGSQFWCTEAGYSPLPFFQQRAPCTWESFLIRMP